LKLFQLVCGGIRLDLIKNKIFDFERCKMVVMVCFD